MIFRKEAKSKQLLEDLIKIYSVQHHIMYDYDLYDIIGDDDKLVGYTLHYKVPGCCYMDILILPEFRNRGIGSFALNAFMAEIYANSISIKSKDEVKSRFLLKNGFKFIEEHIYKDLYTCTMTKKFFNINAYSTDIGMTS